ncbi:MAG: 1,4-beta-xylanase [Opitutales bacterium]
MVSPEDLGVYLGLDAPYTAVAGRWPAPSAREWYSSLPWLVGTNFYPSTAINQIEMWQGSTWDSETIARELKWGRELGFNTHRVYLHDLVWQADPEGFYQRMDQFLDLCAAAGCRPFFVFFDDCHFPTCELGPQPQPVPGYHNSGWVSAPDRASALRMACGAASEELRQRLRGYLQGTLERFRDDTRVLFWELYNEPGRGAGTVTAFERRHPADLEYGNLACRFVQQTWEWAREVAPSQPVASNTAGCVGEVNWAINFMNSDVQSIHVYDPADETERILQQFLQFDRPVLMTEYMARPCGSTFQAILPLLKQHKVAAINWGLVSGKSGTIWPWESRAVDGKFAPARVLREQGRVAQRIEELPEPEVWFHDILRADGTPYDPDEVALIRELTADAVW